MVHRMQPHSTVVAPIFVAPQMAKDQTLPEHRWQGRHVLYFGDNLYRCDQRVQR